MTAEWYYKNPTSKEVGPFTAADLKRLASEGRISPSMMVRKGTEGQWVPASKVKGLVNGEAAKPTAITPAPVVRSPPPVLVSREREEDVPEVYSTPVPRLFSKRKGEDDAEFSDPPPKGMSPGIMIGVAIGSLLVIGLIVLVVSLSGKSDMPSQNQALKPAMPSPADMEQERQARMAEEKRQNEEQDRKATAELARKEEERQERWNRAGREVCQFIGTGAEFTAAAFSKDGRYVGGVCRGQTLISNPTDFGAVYVWQATTGRQLHKFEPKPLDTISNSFTSIDFSPDGELVAAGREDGTIRIWNVENGNEVHLLAQPQLGESISEDVKAVVFSPDGRTLLAVGDGFEALAAEQEYYPVRLWDVSTSRVTRLFRGHSDIVLCAAFSPDGQYAVTGGRDRTAILWNVSEGKEVKLLDAHTSWVTAVAFTSDGRHVLTGSQDRTVRVWDVGSGREVRRFNLESSVNSISCTKNGRYALVGRSMPPDTYLVGTIDSNPVMLDLERSEIAQLPGGFMKKPLENITAVVSPDGRFVLYNAKQRSRVRGNDVVTYHLTLRDLPE